MTRVCFTLQVRPDRIADYRERHASVWSEMLDAIAESGRTNYSLFLRTDGLLVGYYETVDDAASQRRLADDPRTAAWESEMAPFFVAPSGASLGGRPDQSAQQLAEIFNLDAQLGSADRTGQDST